MKRIILIMFVLHISMNVFSRIEENKSQVHIAGSAGLTNNGISLIPNFSLGDPAAMFSMVISKGRLSFVTDFSFSLEAKPWYTLYWIKYQVVEKEKFGLVAGTHLGVNFFDSEVEVNSIVSERLLSDRYWVAEISPCYLINENTSLGVYYLHSRGLDEGTIDASHFLTLNANFSKIKISKEAYLGVNPQLYYLNQDGIDGTYFTSAFTLGKGTFPVTLNAMINQPLKTNISAGNEFVWNFSLVYSFSN